MNTPERKYMPLRLITAASLLALAACASAPVSNPNLDQAHAAYREVSANPAVANTAQRELQQAQQALDRADASFKAGDPVDQVDHYAYIARERVAVADQTGRIAQADQATADAKTQRERIVLASRTREAAEAQRIAQQSQVSAEIARQQVSASQERARTLEQQLADMKARPTDRGLVLTLGDVLFDTGAATLKPGAMHTVDQLAMVLNQQPSRRILIQGYTDSVGSDASNRELSQRRADAVKAALSSRGVDTARVDTEGLGETRFIASNDTASGRQLNRRVEIVFSDDHGAFRQSSQ